MYVTMYSNSSADTTLLVATVIVGVWGNNLYKCARSYNREGRGVRRERERRREPTDYWKSE